MLVRFFVLFATATTLGACSVSSKRTPSDDTKVMLKDGKGQSHEAPKAPISSDAKEITPVSPSDTQQEAAEMKEAVAAAAQHIQNTHANADSHGHARTPGPVTAEKSLGWLKNGNTRFVTGKYRSDGASMKDIKRLSTGQMPHAIVLSCSDSRVPPEVVFDQKLGELFVVRTAGQALDNNVVGSIEYAVAHLGSNLIVVMGHSSCGAIKATLGALDGSDVGSPALNGLVADIKPRLQKFASTKPSVNVEDESWANVDGVARDLAERSAILRDALASGEVRIEKALYHLDSGKVDWL